MITLLAKSSIFAEDTVAIDPVIRNDARVQALLVAHMAAEEDLRRTTVAYQVARLMRRDRIMAYVTDLTQRDTSIYSDSSAFHQRVEALTADFTGFSTAFYTEQDAWNNARRKVQMTQRDLESRIRTLSNIPEPLEP